MSCEGAVILDVGKTHSKLSLCAPDGTLVEHRTRANPRVGPESRRALDTQGIEAWLCATLREFAKLAPFDVIVPVAHGAAAAILIGDRLACAPPDYESGIPPEVAREYDRQRDPFTLTGSPRLPNGLNLGAQLFWLEQSQRRAANAMILTWPQYWAWVLCGVATTEVSSLGCHTDLWYPARQTPSALAHRQGWAAQLAPLHAASDVLGELRHDVAARIGITRRPRVLCGVHDSNAALLAARGFGELAGRDFTVVSTGTWFVLLRSPLGDVSALCASLPELRDCLVNVDVGSRSVPSARFMAGREIELLLHGAAWPDGAVDPPVLTSLRAIARDGTMLLPTAIPGVGPYPAGRGRWIGQHCDVANRPLCVALYVALLLDVCLDLIGARDAILIEGRFAESELLVRLLATLRPRDTVLVSSVAGAMTFGAMRLVDPDLAPPGELRRAAPLDLDLALYRVNWRSAASGQEAA